MPLRIVLSALLTYAVATAMGQIVLSRLKLSLSRAEWWFLAFVTGSACLSALIFLLATLRWIYPGVLLVLAAPLLAVRIGFVRDAYRDAGLPQARLNWRWKAAFW